MRILFFNIFFLFIIASTMQIFSSCRQEIDIDITDTIVDLPVELITTNIAGQVTDNKNNPLKLVSIKIHDAEMLTDDNGYFSFDNIHADQNGTHIIASKSGYFQNIITVYPSLNNSLFSSIVLNEKTESTTMMATNGGTIVLKEGNTIDIAPNTLVYESDGANFEGTAYFEVQLTERSDINFINIFSGELIGLNADDQRVGLNPKAFLQIVVADEHGRALRLAKGQTADLSLSLKGLIDNAVPVPVWQFNPEKNRWTFSANTSSINDEQFIIKISSFNDWTLAPEFDAIRITGDLNYPLSPAMAHQMIFSSNDMELAVLSTDGSGVFSGYIPKNLQIRLEVLNECGEKVHEETIGPFDQSENLHVSINESAACRNIPISGKLIQCNGEPVHNGYVKFMSSENTEFFRTDEEGNYSGSFKVCTAEDFQINGSDQQSNLVSFTHSNLLFQDSINIGVWNICSESEGSISIQFNNSYYFLTENVYSEESAGAILFSGMSKDQYFDCTVPSFHGPGTYLIESATEAEFIFSVLPESVDALSLFPKDSMSYSSFKLEIIEYSEGERLRGTIIGLVRDENNNNVDGLVNINFDVPGVYK